MNSFSSKKCLNDKEKNLCTDEEVTQAHGNNNNKKLINFLFLNF